MPIEQVPVRAFRQTYRCDSCGIGWMSWTGMSLSSNPPKFPHVCSHCGDKATLLATYPMIVHVAEDQDPIDEDQD